MKTDEIIRKLRYRAEGETSAEETKQLLTEATDRLEELDERVAIMSESKTGKWERHYSRSGVLSDVFWWCSNCGEKCLDNWANKYKYCPNCGAKMEDTEP